MKLKRASAAGPIRPGSTDYVYVSLKGRTRLLRAKNISDKTIPLFAEVRVELHEPGKCLQVVGK